MRFWWFWGTSCGWNWLVLLVILGGEVGEMRNKLRVERVELGNKLRGMDVQLGNKVKYNRLVPYPYNNLRLKQKSQRKMSN